VTVLVIDRVSDRASHCGPIRRT